MNQCVQQLPIPELMRAYMYTYGYKNLREAQDLIFSLNLPAQVCTDCSQCSVDCVSGFNISQRVRNIVRLRDVPADIIG